jgi:hypothetical protein
MGSYFIYESTECMYRREWWAWQACLRMTLMGSTLRPAPRTVGLCVMCKDRQTAETWPVPSVAAYRVPYAKSPRHHIQWKLAYAPVRQVESRA